MRFLALVLAAAFCSAHSKEFMFHRQIGNQTQPPLLIIAEGPTGSGKSSQEIEMIRLLSMKHESLVTAHPAELMLIDDYVEKDLAYKQHILAYLQEEIGKSPTDEDIDTWVKAANKSVYDRFAAEYFGSRKDWGCNMSGHGGCEAVFDKKIHDSIAEGKNVIWESTGSRYPADKIALAPGYETIIGLNSVDFCDLVRRNSGRAQVAIVKFMRDPFNPEVSAPRLPDLTLLGPAVSKIAVAAYQTIDCVGEPVSEACPGKVTAVYAFENLHRGILPSVSVRAPSLKNPISAESLKGLKIEAKALIKLMEPKQCPPNDASIVV